MINSRAYKDELFLKKKRAILIHSHCICLNVSGNKPLAFLPFNLYDTPLRKAFVDILQKSIKRTIQHSVCLGC